MRELTEVIATAVILALFMRTFLIQAFVVPSGSMEQTLLVGDHVLVNKFLYYFTPIKRGDIIVFKFPQDESRDFIKRVIGLPGETLEIRGRQVVINGTPLDESYAVFADGPLGRGLEREHVGPLVIPRDHLFMMGDNRDRSMDSRVWGFLDVHKVKGKAFLVYFSIRSEDIPYSSVVPGLVYVVAHPTLIRWNRFGMLIH